MVPRHPGRAQRRAIALLGLAGALTLGGGARFESERAQIRHDAVVVRAVGPATAMVEP